MNHFLIFASILGVAYAGVGQLAPGEEEQIIGIYERLCNEGGGAEGRNVGGVIVYCKQGNNGRRESLRHEVNVPGSSGQDQIVYVRPPPVHYDHKVLIQQNGGQGQKTKIYVLPSKSTHNIETDVVPGSNIPQKPTVYFLNGGSSSNSVNTNQGFRSQPEIRAPIISYSTSEIRSPESSYGAPARG